MMMYASGSVDWTSLTAQIISPVRKSDVGTVRLNAVLQSILNATNGWTQSPSHATSGK